MAKLSPAGLDAFCTRALKEGRLDGKGGLSRQTVLHVHRVLHAALEWGVEMELLQRNVADRVRPPSPEHSEMCALDEEQTAVLLRKARGTRVYIPTLLAATCGLRRSEILGLHWADVDLGARTLLVRVTLVSTGERLIFGPPKTKKSRRVVTLSRLTVEALGEHRRAQVERASHLDSLWHDHDLVCPGSDGRPWHPDTFTSAWRKFQSGCGLTLRSHDLRHTHASQLMRQGESVRAVADRLGHSTATLTLDTYGHCLPGQQEQAAKKTDARLSKALAALDAKWVSGLR